MTGNHKTELNHILDKILNLHTNVYSETEEYKILQQKFSIDSFDVTNRDQPRLAIDNHLIQIKKQVAEITNPDRRSEFIKQINQIETCLQSLEK